MADSAHEPWYHWVSVVWLIINLFCTCTLDAWSSSFANRHFRLKDNILYRNNPNFAVFTKCCLHIWADIVISLNNHQFRWKVTCPGEAKHQQKVMLLVVMSKWLIATYLTLLYACMTRIRSIATVEYCHLTIACWLLCSPTDRCNNFVLPEYYQRLTRHVAVSTRDAHMWDGLNILHTCGLCGRTTIWLHQAILAPEVILCIKKMWVNSLVSNWSCITYGWGSFLINIYADPSTFIYPVKSRLAVTFVWNAEQRFVNVIMSWDLLREQWTVPKNVFDQYHSDLDTLILIIN